MSPDADRTRRGQRTPQPMALSAQSNPLITYWYFHLPNFLLAALMYTLLGRVMLGLIVDPNSQNYIWRFFCRFTDPVVRVSRS